MRNTTLRPAPENLESDNKGGHDWDPTRPLAEQWPWCGFGPSNDEPFEVQIEMRAAELAGASSDLQTAEDRFGYSAHYHGYDIPPGGDAGWLEREISTWRPQWIESDDEIVAAVVHSPPRDPDAGWDHVIEQTRHDVAESVVRHAEIDPLDRVILAGAPEVIALTPRQVRARSAEEQAAEDEDRAQCATAIAAWRRVLLDGIDQSEPDPTTSSVEQVSGPPSNTDDEVTQIDATDSRFDATEVEP